MTRLSLDAIKIIDTIKETGSFSMAADVLHKTPSAISYRVANIENKLNVKLFHRHGPVVSLTEEGEFLLTEGRWIVNAVQDLENRVRNIPKLTHEIRIVVDTFFPHACLTQDIREFIGCYPHASISVRRETLNGVWDALKSNRADLAIATGAVPDNVAAKTLMLGKLDFALCISPSHPFAAQRRPVSKQQRLDDILIAIGDSSHELPRRQGEALPLQRQLQLCDVESALSLLKRGVGHAFLPPALVAAELEKGELVTADVDWAKGDEMLWLAWHPACRGEAFDWWRQRLRDKSARFGCEGYEMVREGGCR